MWDSVRGKDLEGGGDLVCVNKDWPIRGEGKNYMMSDGDDGQRKMFAQRSQKIHSSSLSHSYPPSLPRSPNPESPNSPSNINCQSGYDLLTFVLHRNPPQNHHQPAPSTKSPIITPHLPTPN